MAKKIENWKRKLEDDPSEILPTKQIRPPRSSFSQPANW